MKGDHLPPVDYAFAATARKESMVVVARPSLRDMAAVTASTALLLIRIDL
jgi:hypothetical protein